MNKISQRDMVLRHLQDFGEITSWEAIKEYGVTRLSAVIYDLRKVYVIEDEWEKGYNRYGNPTRWVKYKLCGIK